MTLSEIQDSVIKGKGYTAKVIRTNRRKTASIKVVEGCVSVIVPNALTIENIESLLFKKQRWIREKLALQSEAIPNKSKEFVSGESFSYLGRNYRLKVVNGDYPAIKLYQGRFVVSVRDKTGNNTEGAIKQLMIRWFKQRAESKLLEKTNRYAKIIGVSPASINIKTFKSRWGSCGRKDDILYNWQIIMSPNRVVDYVVNIRPCHKIVLNLPCSLCQYSVKPIYFCFIIVGKIGSFCNHIRPWNSSWNKNFSY